MYLKNDVYDVIDSKYTLKNYLLYKDTAYKFTLTLSVNDFYKSKIGNAPQAYAYITVYNGLIPNVIKELTIE